MTDLLANIRVLDFTLTAVGPFCTTVATSSCYCCICSRLAWC